MAAVLAVSFLVFASPIVATVLGYVFLDQKLTVVQVVGALVIVGAVVFAQPRPAKTIAGLEKPVAVPERSTDCHLSIGG